MKPKFTRFEDYVRRCAPQTHQEMVQNIKVSLVSLSFLLVLITSEFVSHALLKAPVHMTSVPNFSRSVLARGESAAIRTCVSTID